MFSLGTATPKGSSNSQLKWLKGENPIKGPRKRRRRRKQKETVSTEFLPSMMTLLKNLFVEGAKISNEDGESAVINQMVTLLNEARSVARSKIINAGGVPTKEEVDRLAMEMMRE